MYGRDADRDAGAGGLLSEVTNYPWPNPSADEGGHASGGIQFSLEGVLNVDPDVLFVQTLAFPGFQPPPLVEQPASNPQWGSQLHHQLKHALSSQY